MFHYARLDTRIRVSEGDVVVVLEPKPAMPQHDVDARELCRYVVRGLDAGAVVEHCVSRETREILIF